MGWETRNGRTYYYQKERIGGKVISRYIGSGEVAELSAQLDSIEQERQTLKRLGEQQERVRLLALDQEIAAYYDQVETVLRQTLKAAGYHQHHRGEWRKRRAKNQEDIC